MPDMENDMHAMEMAPRNDPLGFMQRSQQNLRLIEERYADKKEGHVVTQLVQSLLAFVVFPKAKHYYETMDHLTLDYLEEYGWPRPEQKIGKTNTLRELLWHMRNAVSHGLVVFHGHGPDGSNSRELSEISIEFSDRPNETSPFNWQIVIEGLHLRAFVFRMIEVSMND